MSNAVTNLCRPIQIPQTEKAILMCLADAASDNGHAFMLVSTLMLYSCLGERTVRRSISGLVSRGFVRQELRKGRSSVFWLEIEAIEAAVLPEHKARMTPASEAPPKPKSDAAAAPSHACQAPSHACQAPITMSYPCPTPKPRAMDSFESRFWATYPKSRRVDKRRCERLWRDKGLEAQVEQVMRVLAADICSPQWTKDGGQFIPHPATWLNQDRFAREVEAAPDTRDKPPCACGAPSVGKIGHRFLCKTHFYERDD